MAKNTEQKNKNEQYQPASIEPKWQAKWEKERLYQPDLDTAKNPYYNLMMFPYPSAEGLHVGNMYAFTGADINGRFKRMQGSDVFEPFGLDGFGIHSENYALKVGAHPMEQAEKSEANFYRQLHLTGNGYDWSRTVETYKPEYYKWTQWLFIKLFQAGLAYKAKAPVNFCPSCKTVLADEQVIDGKCERCGSVVEKRDLEQWFFQITKYADRLLADLDKINWTEKVKIAQRNWIGKKEGASIEFRIKNQESRIKVFTTRPDTLYGATFLVLSPEHPYLQSEEFKANSGNVREVQEYIKAYKSTKKDTDLASEKEKTGVYSGIDAIHPTTKEKIPVWVSDYVLMEYGSGAIMAVPAHDERDFEFAKNFGLAIKPVIDPTGSFREAVKKEGEDVSDQVLQGLLCWPHEGMIINSADWNGLDYAKKDDREKIFSDIEKDGFGSRQFTYHLRDWLISRQRYWGPPIPMVFCETCFSQGKGEMVGVSKEHAREWNPAGWYVVPQADLPVKLPYIEDFKPVGTGKAPLANHEEFYKTTCPACGSQAIRETDVSDTFLDSAWYFLRYLATDFEDIAFPSEKLAENLTSKISDLKDTNKIGNWKLEIGNSTRRVAWLPVTMYIGGAEHSVLHLLYARFVTKVLYDLGMLTFEEPFSTFYAHGLIIKDGTKMSKSKGNVVVPDEYMAKFGSDTLRTYLMFLGSFNEGGDFRDTGIEGMYRFIKRVWTLFSRVKNQESRIKNEDEVLSMLNKTIKGVTSDMERLHYNTAIAKLMELYNFLSKQEHMTQAVAETYLKLLAPFAPHMTEELWARFGHTSSIHISPWPVVDETAIAEGIVTIVVQINGKLRGKVEFPAGAKPGQEEVETKAKVLGPVAKYLDGKSIQKTIYVPNRLLNFVIGE